MRIRNNHFVYPYDRRGMPMPTGTTLTRQWAEHLLALQPQQHAAVMSAARAGLVDYLACALGGAHDPGLHIVESVYPGTATGTATVLGRGYATDAGRAALLNGYSGHALDYDDVQRSVRGHPSTVLLPALLALAEIRGASAERLLGAYAVGVQAMASLGLATGPAHYEAGYHNTATLGAIAAAAACGWLIDLPAAPLTVAIGIAVTQASGLRAQFGSQVKPLHAGLAAQAGLNSALLAEAGLTGATEALDGEGGFFALTSHGAATPLELLAPVDVWQIVQPGLVFKRYASCAATHHAADAALALHAAGQIHAPAIETLRVIFPPGLTAPLAKTLPTDRSAGRFSVEYVVAHALVHGHLDFAAFGSGPIDPSTAELMKRVQVDIDPSAPAIGTSPLARFSVLQVTQIQGAPQALRVDAPRPGVPAEKFAAALGRAPRARVLLEQIQTMHSADDLQSLLAALALPPTRDENAE